MIGQIPSKSQNGNSSENLSYDFQDTERSASENVYYRLRQTDFDGTVSLSQIAHIIIAFSDLEVQAYPNPIIDDTQVSVASPLNGKVVLELVSMDGRKVISREIALAKGANFFDLDTKNLQAGIYILKIQSNAIDKRIKLIKR